MTEHEDEIAKCAQCDWPITRADLFMQDVTQMMRVCDNCDKIHDTGYVHIRICSDDLLAGVARAVTQGKRAAALGMN